MTTSTHHLTRWQSMWRQLGVISPGEGLLVDVMQRYAEPHRHYHTMQHLDQCFAQFDSVRQEAMRAAEIELALWFHDAIYDVKSHNNEQQSADWVRSVLFSAGGSTTVADRVHALVMVTCHNALPISPDEQILVDVDLSILGAKPARFAEYEMQVRAEYAWVPEATYRSKRAEILQAFLDRGSIYSTAYFRALVEASARRNLAGSIACLTQGAAR